MKRTNRTILMVFALVAIVFAQIAQARPVVINDEVTYDTGAIVNHKGTLKIDDVTVSTSAAELNILDGVTATAAELNAVDGILDGVGAKNGATVTATESAGYV